MALVLAAVMALVVAGPAYAAPVENDHTITITNTDQNVAHTYEAYKVFSGNLDAAETKLADIAWAEGVDGSGLLADLKASTDTNLVAAAAMKDALGNDLAAGENIFKNCTTAQDVAKVLATMQSTNATATDNAGAIDAVATIIADNLATKAADFVADGNTYTADVTGDGYYFIKDTTATLQDDETGKSDTKSKYLLSVIKDTTIVAKDTGLDTDKKIVAGQEKVAADSAAIGDTVTFEVTATVPNTKKYEDHFWFVMNDQLPTGITFTGISSVTIGSATVTDAKLATPSADPYTAANYDGTLGFYTLKITDALPTITSGKYPWEATDYDAVAEAGGQKITLTFNEFKKFVEANDLIGQTVTVTYTGVVNDDATFTKTANENEVTFTYSTDPNTDYDGDNPNGTDPTGTTPKDTTRTYTTSLKIMKVDENGDPLAGATFELKGDALNRTVITGTMFVKSTDAADPAKTNGGTVDTSKSYWLLKDGSYTDTNPATEGMNTTQYASTEDIYYKVTFATAEVAAKTTDLVVVTDANGLAVFTGINEGEYTLEEIAAPEGYNKIEGKADITVTWTDPEAEGAASPAKDQGGFTLTATEFAEAMTFNATDNQFTVEIENQSGQTLPSTGGMGTRILYTVGGAMIVAGGIYLVAKKRLSAME